MLRGAAVGLVAAMLGIGLHTWSQDAAASPEQLAAIAPPAVVVGIAMAGRRYSFGRAFAVLLLLQPVLHLAALSTHHPDHSAPSAVLPVADTSMFAAHVVAAALAAWWVSVGDDLLWRWLGTVITRLAPRLVVVRHDGRPLALAITTTAASRRIDHLLWSAPRRGPPARFGRRAVCA